LLSQSQSTVPHALSHPAQRKLHFLPQFALAHTEFPQSLSSLSTVEGRRLEAGAARPSLRSLLLLDRACADEAVELSADQATTIGEGGRMRMRVLPAFSAAAPAPPAPPPPTPAAAVKVYLNIYDISPINNYLYWFGLGIFHSGVEGTYHTLCSSPTNLIHSNYISTQY
jgi:hypothetical protein